MGVKFNEITTINELANFLQVQMKTLTYVLYYSHVGSFYRKFEIPKKSGGYRNIEAPIGVLKVIQRKLSNKLYAYQECICKENKIKLNISHAFEKKKSIITNAEIHRNKRFIINIDLKDFFNSFHFGRVRGYFMKNKYFSLPIEVATVISQLTCNDGKLPQGAPSSPIITNMICSIMDFRILSLAKQYRLDYTRYADDLTFSTNDKKIISNYDKFYNGLNKIIAKSGFEINIKKSSIIYKDSKQVVTGLIVNKRINVDRIYYKLVRAMAHRLYTSGEFLIDKKVGTINQLEGMFAFINIIEKYNNKISFTSPKKIYNLNAKEREYQKFLFYRYLYANDKPVIVTEGRTDIIYIKAALKSLYKDYPNLIEKDSNGRFVFKISFFKRSKRIRFFYNMSFDGADAMKNIYRFFSDIDNEKYPNYSKYFTETCAHRPKNPVILIFDNEIATRKRPLYEFLSFCGLKDETFNNGGYRRIKEDGNLYLATHQLMNGKQESEIEDLFKESVLKHEINGKTFNRTSSFDKTINYGKEIFANYINQEYQGIDFSNFKPLLNAINAIVTEYREIKIS